MPLGIGKDPGAKACFLFVARVGLIVSSLVGCEGENPPPTPTPVASSGSSASTMADTLPDIETLRRDRDGDYRYLDGVELCCAKGEGDACCSDYSEYSDGPCTEHGGPFGRCLEAGEATDWRVSSCIHCCEGLERVSVKKNVDGECVPGFPSFFVCSRCGDGLCTRYEECTCPRDCP